MELGTGSGPLVLAKFLDAVYTGVETLGDGQKWEQGVREKEQAELCVE